MATRVPERIDPTFPPAHPWVGEQRRFVRTRHGIWLLTRFFLSKEAWIAWPLLLLAIGQQFGSIYVALWSNSFEKQLFDAVQQGARDQLTVLMITFLAVSMATISVAVVGELFRESLAIRWRRWLAADYTGRWLGHRQYYAIERGTLVDNPDQRMSEDITLFVDGALKLFLGVIYVCTSVTSFGIVLWRLSGGLDLRPWGIPVVLPGDMVWMAVIYTLIGSVALVYIGKPLVRRTMKQQHYEADFRYQLVAIRRNVEQIALSRLEKGEWARLRSLYQIVKNNFMQLLYFRVAITFLTQTFLQLKAILPLLLSLPRFFAGQITMGDMMQTRGAFTAFSQSISWFIMAYEGTVVPTISAMNRLRMLDLMIERAPVDGVTITSNPGEALKIEALSLRLPVGKPLANIGDWTIERGSRWLIRGKSGAGKSSLLRAIAGIWPDGDGAIRLPADARLHFVPQQPYLGNGSLSSILSFPEAPDTFSDDQYVEVLRRVHLEKFTGQIHETAFWSDTMSPGEQQRIGFARILLHRPTHLFLDEATSALDPETALAMYRLVAKQPELTIVSVVHSDVLDPFHDHCLQLDEGRATLCNTPSNQDKNT